jgi:hypothetical protein
LGNKWGIAISLINWGHVALAQGDHATARKLLEESLMLLREMGHKHHIAASLVGWASLALALKQLPRAVTLSGAVTTVLEVIGARLGEPEQTIHIDTVATLRAQLPAADFDTAWAAGRGMMMEEAVRLAMECG